MSGACKQLTFRKWDISARDFDLENPEVWDLFEFFSLQAIDAGRTRMGAKMIFERIRWHSVIETTSMEYKLNNNHTSYYARKFNLAHHSEFTEDLFVTRDR